jgi:hypothetical protein
MDDIRLGALRYKIGSFWESGLALIFLLLAIVAIMLIVFTRPDYGQAHHEGMPVVATITRIGSGGSKYRPYLRIVTLRDGENADHQLTVPVDMIAGCKIGDHVMAIRSNVAFTLQPMPCRR